MKKYDFFKGGVNDLAADVSQTYINKYYNLWMSKYKWKGLDEEQANQQQDFIMRKFWADGTIACRYIKNVDMLVWAPWATFTLNMYDQPNEITLVRLNNAPESLVPSTPLTVNKDVVIGWAQPNHKSIYSIVKYYVDRLVQVELLINTNLQLQKLPWIIGVNEADEAKMKDVVKRILNNEVVVFTSLEDLGKIQALATNTPYIIDKLDNYKHCIELELLTFLGIDNSGTASLEQTHISVDAVNSNNDMINNYSNAITQSIQAMLSDIKRISGRVIEIEELEPSVQSIHEEQKPVEKPNKPEVEKNA